MTVEEFHRYCNENIEPDNPYLYSLYLAKRGDWNAAHKLVDSLGTTEAAWIHAFLHREEGDLWNAGYWYRRAGKEVATGSLNKEFKQLVEYFCKNE